MSRAPGPAAPPWPAAPSSPAPESPSPFSPPGSRARAVASQPQPAQATEHAQCGAPGLGWGWAGAGPAAQLPRGGRAGRGRRANRGCSLAAGGGRPDWVEGSAGERELRPGKQLRRAPLGGLPTAHHSPSAAARAACLGSEGAPGGAGPSGEGGEWHPPSKGDRQPAEGQGAGVGVKSGAVQGWYPNAAGGVGGVFVFILIKQKCLHCFRHCCKRLLFM